MLDDREEIKQVVEHKIFCQKCKQRLYRPQKLLGITVKKGMEVCEFEDGYYCMKCGKAKVEEARAKK